MKQFVRTLYPLIYYRSARGVWCLTCTISGLEDVQRNSLLLALDQTEYDVLVLAPDGSIVFVDKEDVKFEDGE